MDKWDSGAMDITRVNADATSPLPQLEGPVNINTPGPLKDIFSTLTRESVSYGDAIMMLP